MNYAVIFNYSFDNDVAVYLFNDYEAAKQFLRESYEEELRIDTEENGWDSEGYISEEGDYASITTRFYDYNDIHEDSDVTEMRIGHVYQQLNRKEADQ